MTNKILIVDDHMMVRDGISVMIDSQRAKHDFVIYEAESGEEAYNKVKKEDFDIIIMDYKLPRMNGAETTRRRKAGSVLLLVVSDDQDPKLKAKFLLL